jgi:hypothetical protein
VKVTIGSHFITIEDCEIFNPGTHTDGGKYEQNVDFMDTECAVVRRCLLYHVGGHGDQIGFFKAGSRGCRFEQNVVLDAGGGPDDSPAFTLGQDSDSEYKHSDYACYDSIVRDNVFVNCRNGAIGFYGCKGGYAYGNVIINSCPPFGFNRDGVGVNPAIDQIFILDNAVLNPAGNLDRLFEGREKLNGRLLHDYNMTWNGARKPPREANEPHARRERLDMAALTGVRPSEGYAALAARFAALAPHGPELLADLPAEARAGEPGQGLPVPPRLLATAPLPPAQPATPQPAQRVTTARPAVDGPALTEEDPLAQPDLAAREASAPKAVRPRLAMAPHLRRSARRAHPAGRRLAAHRRVALRSHSSTRRARPRPRRNRGALRPATGFAPG